MNKIIGIIALVGAFALWQHAAYASDVLAGKYNFTTTGSAQLGSPTKTPCTSTDLVTAGLSNGTIIFDGYGNIQTGLSTVNVSIGSTSCGYYFLISGHYKVDDHGDGSFLASGTMTLESDNPYAPCNRGSTALHVVPFSVIGDNNTGIYTISTSGAGAGSIYAEGTPGGGNKCEAPITNFNTQGPASRVGRP